MKHQSRSSKRQFNIGELVTLDVDSIFYPDFWMSKNEGEMNIGMVVDNKEAVNGFYRVRWWFRVPSENRTKVVVCEEDVIDIRRVEDV